MSAANSDEFGPTDQDWTLLLKILFGKRELGGVVPLVLGVVVVVVPTVVVVVGAVLATFIPRGASPPVAPARTTRAMTTTMDAQAALRNLDFISFSTVATLCDGIGVALARSRQSLG